MAREKAADQGEDGYKHPVAPLVLPAGRARDNREEEGSGEVARDEPEKADHGPDTLSHEDGSNEGNDKQSKESADCAST